MKVAIRRAAATAATALVLSAPGCSTDDAGGAAPTAWEHLQRIEALAHEHGGNRGVGTPGGDATRALVEETLTGAGLEVHRQQFDTPSGAKGTNVWADVPGTSGNVVVVGAHYDSVAAGPGVNDNGSGVAALLEVAESLSKTSPHNTIRFAFWDGEENQISGSTKYVEAATPEELAHTRMYLNFDMVGTADPTVTLYDSDNSSVERFVHDSNAGEQYAQLLEPLKVVPDPRAVEIENLLFDEFTAAGFKTEDDLTFNTATDTAPFSGKVPTGGAGFLHITQVGDTLEFAPGYHTAGDTLATVDPDVLSRATQVIHNVTERAGAADS